ncbi:hypothetical protein CPJCM30710_32450 [Clostridium polyendosporum]|uniref:Fe-only nitrogenase accessory protein AnfO n=1 Tax=Clostridium polyendosporum TaxID=69208 RepID=A0A919S2D0_9CLOT|nr:Fe-only nitrogenase accessory protein AnfO [Clostridium polyendosporum]GIM30579.1 hypothetical protein CPJCM30710_32450 [Clostridium polyendosporum]
MGRKIAVVLDENGQTSTFYESSVIKVYTKEKEEWKVISETSLSDNKMTGTKLIRESIKNIVEYLNECRVIVAKEVSGIPHTVLDMAGFKIFEVEGEPEELLDPVLEILEQGEVEKTSSVNDNDIKVEPIPLNKEGSYYINLKEVQKSKPGITSKGALLPFLRNNTFYELEVICSHIPPWMESELKRLHMGLDITQNSSGEYKIIIYRKTCNEN